MSRVHKRNVLSVLLAIAIAWVVSRRPARGEIARLRSLPSPPLASPQALTSPAPGGREGRLSRWAAPLALIATALLITTGWLVRELVLQPTIERPRGGLLLFASGRAAESALAEVSADIRGTGWPGVSELWLTLKFSKPPSDLVVYAIVSGQYAVPSDADINSFCTGAHPGPEEGTLTCRNSEVFMGLSDVEYRPGGLGIVRDGGVYNISDYAGYDLSDSSLLQGRVAPRTESGLPEGEVRFNFPIRTPVTVSRGGESDGALAPIAGQDAGDAGVGSLVRTVLGTDGSLWADTGTGQRFSPLTISRVSLDAGDVAPTAAVTRSAPQTSSSNRLRWVDPELRQRGVTYTVTDGNLTNSALLRTFLAGLTASAALSMLVMAAEPYLRKRAGYSPF